jgi:hypothetical protein
VLQCNSRIILQKLYFFQYSISHNTTIWNTALSLSLSLSVSLSLTLKTCNILHTRKNMQICHIHLLTKKKVLRYIYPLFFFIKIYLIIIIDLYIYIYIFKIYIYKYILLISLHCMPMLTMALISPYRLVLR